VSNINTLSPMAYLAIRMSIDIFFKPFHSDAIPISFAGCFMTDMHDEFNLTLEDKLSIAYNRLINNTTAFPGQPIIGSERYMLYMNDFYNEVHKLSDRGLNIKKKSLFDDLKMNKDRILHVTRLGLHERFYRNLEYVTSFRRKEQPDTVTIFTIDFLLADNAALVAKLLEADQLKKNPQKASLADIIHLYPKPSLIRSY
jgi:hypothetical protein